MTIAKSILKTLAELQEGYKDFDEVTEEIQIRKIDFQMADTINADTHKICTKIYRSFEKLIVDDEKKNTELDELAEVLKIIEARARIGHSHNQPDDKKEK